MFRMTSLFVCLLAAGAHAGPAVDLTDYIEAPQSLMIADGGTRLSSDHVDAPHAHDDLHAPRAGGHVHSSSRADAHAPIGVMAEHVHKAGEFMLSYRYMRMHMDGSRSGDSSVDDADVRADGFMVVPEEMDMEMHMFGAMHAPTDWLTLMVMVPYIRNTMDHRAGMPLGSVNFATSSEGLGDIKLSGMVPVVHKGPHTLLGTMGVSLPTGSIEEKDRTRMGRVQLPYPMQLGSGTFDLLPSATYTYQQPKWSAGGQVSGVIRLGRNNNHYSLGDRFAATGWWSWLWTEALSTSFRLNYQIWGNIDGADPNFAAIIAPTLDPQRRGGQRLDALVGVNLYAPDGPLRGHRLAVEFGVPVYQKLEGPQLETDWLLTAGWQFAF